MESNPSKRPWQGTFLAILNILIAVAMGATTLLFLTVTSYLNDLLAAIPGLDQLIAWGTGTFIVFLLLFLLTIFICRGLFKGKKWAVLFNLIGTSLALFGIIWTIIQVDFDPLLIIFALFYGFLLYLAISCIKHPYYK